MAVEMSVKMTVRMAVQMAVRPVREVTGKSCFLQKILAKGNEV